MWYHVLILVTIACTAVILSSIHTNMYYVIVKHCNDEMNMIMIITCCKCFDHYPLKFDNSCTFTIHIFTTTSTYTFTCIPVSLSY